ncbi:hypothetical protein BC834DRAFT_902306 [Gloeopeniophorella convolvens]|nr:hypothetical protein BC834DRAFT_902306 [Gloeopeniophorella convolvens]
MATIGSVFLGDVQRNRLRSSGSTPGSTPPSSPPPAITTTQGMMQPLPPSILEFDPEVDALPPQMAVPPQPAPAPQPPLAPAQSLELRVRWLEALLYGVKAEDTLARPGERHASLKRGDTVARAAERAQRRLGDLAGAHDPVRKFLAHYEQHAQYLTPAFALSGTLPSTAPPAYADMSPSELAALAAELEPDIRAADRDMREIEALQQRGTAGAGKLAEYEALQPRLEALLLRHEEDLARAAALEKRVGALVRQYTLQVDTLSELFVAWDETLRGAEDRVGKLEKEREERARLGFE